MISIGIRTGRGISSKAANPRTIYYSFIESVVLVSNNNETLNHLNFAISPNTQINLTNNSTQFDNISLNISFDTMVVLGN